MTGRIKLSFSSPVNEEPDRNLIIGSLEQRKEAFKGDEELMKETNKFVTEVIETAASEASKRKIEKENASASEGSRLKGNDILGGWNNRARGFCNRVLNAIFPCFTNNGNKS